MQHLHRARSFLDDFPGEAVRRLINEEAIDFTRLNVEEFWQLVSRAEQGLGIQFVRMDFGVPGLPPPHVAIEGQVRALRESSVASQYPPHQGVPRLRDLVASFMRRLFNLEVDPSDCVVTCGATEALFAAQAITSRRRPATDTVVFLEPGYPPSKAQARFLGLRQVGLDLYRYRRDDLIGEVRNAFETGRVSAICWSSPNNPAWIYLTEEELEGIGRLCNEYGVTAIEDLAYLGIDPPTTSDAVPLQPTIAHYTDMYVLVLSASKMFSYAGERIGFLIGAPALMAQESSEVERYFGACQLRRAISSLVFNLTAGAPHSAQYAVVDLLEAIEDEEYKLVESMGEYRQRSKRAQEIISGKGFELICGAGEGQRCGNGFYFTFKHTGFEGGTLLRELLCYGVSVLPLSAFGSCKTDGLRACVAQLEAEDMLRLEHRLSQFQRDHGG